MRGYVIIDRRGALSDIGVMGGRVRDNTRVTGIRRIPGTAYTSVQTKYWCEICPTL